MEQEGLPDKAPQALLHEAANAIVQNDASVTFRAEIIFYGQKILASIPSGPVRQKNLEPVGHALFEQYEVAGEFAMLEDVLGLISEAI